jgi:hypothetical protein
MTTIGETARQRIWRDRVESVLRLAAPMLDLLLEVGDRASRVLNREDPDHYPIRPAGEAFEIEAARRRAGPDAGRSVD